jgi:hypothetical protein
MSDIVGRLRNWRTVHLAWLHLLMEEAADEMERLSLSANGDFPDAENVANEDKVLTASERSVLREVCEEYADEDDVRCGEIAYVIDRLLSRAGKNGDTAGEDAAKCTVKSEKLPERDRLTAAEREAVEVAAEAYADDHGERFAATLRNLLERLG